MTDMVEVPLHAVAHSRAGDKGNRANLSLIPYRAELYPLLAEQVTEAFGIPDELLAAPIAFDALPTAND